MNNKAIEELYNRAYSEEATEWDSGSVLEMHEMKREIEESFSSLMSKASSEETKLALTELHELFDKRLHMAQVNTFVVGFKRGGQLISNIVN